LGWNLGKTRIARIKTNYADWNLKFGILELVSLSVPNKDQFKTNSIEIIRFCQVPGKIS